MYMFFSCTTQPNARPNPPLGGKELSTQPNALKGYEA